jgi:hypothetical protein
MSALATETAWENGRFDARRRPGELLFGRMHEDSSIELAAFRTRGRIFCIASAGCTAMDLSREHDIVAVDINPAQVDYVSRRLSGAAPSPGKAERMMARGRALAPAVGWSRTRIREFLDLDDPGEQVSYWTKYLDTRRFRVAMDLALSPAILRLTYARAFLDCLPPRFGRVLRTRMERCFARHPNRENPYATAFLTGRAPDRPLPPATTRIQLVHSDAAEFLEREPPGRFDGFALSNILDAAGEEYRRRLVAAVRRAAAPDAVAVIRSFSEPTGPSDANIAAEDRSMIWGIVEAKAARAL